jgi:hypothetical protein
MHLKIGWLKAILNAICEVVLKCGTILAMALICSGDCLVRKKDFLLQWVWFGFSSEEVDWGLRWLGKSREWVS